MLGKKVIEGYYFPYTSCLKCENSEKRKTYTALCYSKVPLDEEVLGRLRRLHFPIEISQKTAIRVLKRRPLADRKRNIFSLSAHLVDSYHFLIRYVAQVSS